MKVQQDSLTETQFVVECDGVKLCAAVRGQGDLLDTAACVEIASYCDNSDGTLGGYTLDRRLTLDEAKALRKALTAAIRHLEDAEDE